jgi:hypothetical protein
LSNTWRAPTRHLLLETTDLALPCTLAPEHASLSRACWRSPNASPCPHPSSHIRRPEPAILGHHLVVAHGLVLLKAHPDSSLPQASTYSLSSEPKTDPLLLKPFHSSEDRWDPPRASCRRPHACRLPLSLPFVSLASSSPPGAQRVFYFGRESRNPRVHLHGRAPP